MSGIATDTMVRIEDVHKSYGAGAAAVHALRGVSLEIPRGELVALKGRSGSGKTTLLNIVGGLDAPDRGRVLVDGLDLAELSEDGLLALRRDRVGFVFPSFGLIPILSAAENVGVPLRMRRADPREREERVELLLSLVGLADHAGQRPGSCPAASNSAWPSHAPWPTTPPSSSPTSPPASPTRTPGTPSWSCCGRSCAARASRPWSPRTTRPCWTWPTGCWN